MNKEPLAGQLEQIISGVILPMETAGVDIDPAAVSREVDRIIDPSGRAPEIKTYAAILQVRAVTRKMLAKRHDPVKKAEDYITEETDDLFDDQLQPYYPVKRKADYGKDPVYIRREKLTDFDVQAIVKRMSKAGDSLIEHATALKAWHRGRDAA